MEISIDRILPGISALEERRNNEHGSVKHMKLTLKASHTRVILRTGSQKS